MVRGVGLVLEVVILVDKLRVFHLVLYGRGQVLPSGTVDFAEKLLL